MNKAIIRCLAFLLAAILLLIGCASCGNGNGSGEQTSSTKSTRDQNGDASASGTEEGTEEPDPMYAENGNGRDFIILGRLPYTYIFAYDEVAPENDGDRVPSAIFRRNDLLNNTFGINIVEALEEAVGVALERDVLSGLHTYDIVMPTTTIAVQQAANGYLEEFGLIPYVDLSQDYWLRYYNDSLTIGGNLFYATGCSNISAYNSVGVIFFNKYLHKQYNLQDLYSMVKEGDWTIEQMLTMARTVTSDTDGTPGMSATDTYGILSGTYAWMPFFHGADYLMVEKDPVDDLPYLVPTSGSGNAEIINDVLSQICTFLNDKTAAILAQQVEGFSQSDAMNENRGLFWIECVYGQIQLRDMKQDYGIIPMPKWKESAEYYVSQPHVGWTSSSCIVAGHPDKNLSGAVMEEMAKLSQRILIPEFYEQTIRLRGSRDAESYEMLGLIYEHIVADIAVAFSASGLSLDTGIRNMLILGNTSFATMFKRSGGSYAENIDEIARQLIKVAEKQHAEAEGNPS